MAKAFHQLPSVDEVLRAGSGRIATARFGHTATVGAIRDALDGYRRARRDGAEVTLTREAAAEAIAAGVVEGLDAAEAPRLRRVFNMTGTVLHTNLGRAIYADEAIEAARSVMASAAALEFDLETGGRGERDDVVRDLICTLTGAEDAIVVNNNAAAVLLVLNTLALEKESIVSRGELIEIGGAFRMPDIMQRAGTCLREVGTTNRTHLKDYAGAIGPLSGLILKVHTSNYVVQGFTKEVAAPDLAQLARETSVPLVDDLGSGTLVDLGRFGLRRERTVQDAVKDGADLVTFSGDKLLGGPQAGFIVGKKSLVEACAKNPIKRALRLDKVRLAALESTLKLYRDPDRLADRLPTLRYLARSASSLRELAGELITPLQAALGTDWDVTHAACVSQIGSGALPLETIESAGISLAPFDRKSGGRLIEALSAKLRALPIPVVGRIEKGAIILDVRCLDDSSVFIGQLDRLSTMPNRCTVRP